MQVKIHEELEKHIWPLKQEEYKLLEQGKMGFYSKEYSLWMTPSDIGPLWFHASMIDDKTMTEIYTKRPMALSRLLRIKPISDIVQNEQLIPFKANPKPDNYNDRNYTQKSKGKTNVYFIQSINGGPVKIGIADNIDLRLKQLQTGSPFILKIIKVFEGVDYGFEKELQEKFKRYRLHGEWFDEKTLNLI
jgi:hypothetical protein